MCWSASVTLTMVGIGAVATGVSIAQKQPRAISLTLGYFTLMEALQAVGYGVIDECGAPANQTVTMLSVLHIIFQPFFINAFAMELLPKPVKQHLQTTVYVLCGAAAAVMLVQLYPFEWAGHCRIGQSLCGTTICTFSGEWHQAWSWPYNGLLSAIDNTFGLNIGFPTYVLAGFALPLVYGAWRLVIFHALFGPILAGWLTDSANEAPAVWCLFSIGIILIAMSPLIRQRFATTQWWFWPKEWQAREPAP